jgi:hypothetical protein
VSNWQKHLSYLQVRLTQALEFRRAAHSLTLLTAPLTLYYSFLNLMRAYMTLRHEVQAGKHHGLSFHAAASLFESEASLKQANIDNPTLGGPTATTSKSSWPSPESGRPSNCG